MNTPAAVSAPPPVGFVGVGHMGSGMARRLLAAGHPLIVYNRDASKTSALVTAGATVADRPIEVGRRVRSGIVFLSLSDGPAVRAVLFGRGGLARGLSTGAVVVNTSTVGVEECRTFAERLAERGVGYLDAPVGGSADAAAEGRLLFYVGGLPETLDRVRPVLGPLAREVVHVGSVGAGSVAKIANNLVTIGTVSLLAEALAVAQASGIDRAAMVEVLAKGGARSAMLENKREFFAKREYPTRFSLALARKDLKLAERAARDAGQPLVATPAARRLYERAMSEGYGEADLTAVLETVIRARSGRAPPADAPGPEPAGSSAPTTSLP